MYGFVLLLVQALVYFAVMAGLIKLRRRMGLGVFLCALGVMHFLETYLAAVYFIELPFGLISPGSTVLFSGKLAMLLLLYVLEDAETVRQPIYGLLVGNFLLVGLVVPLKLYGAPAVMPGYNPDLYLLDQIGALMVWGTSLLFIDSIAMILLFERLRHLSVRPFFQFVGSLGCILTFDQIGFFAGLHLIAGTPFSALLGGWLAKMGAAATFSLLVAIYIHYFEREPSETYRSLADVFSKLTYRHRYEELLEKQGVDALTGALNRERLQVLGEAILSRALPENRPVSVSMIDVDHFKEINDRYGHIVGDETLKRLVDKIRHAIRSTDRIFRYGGDEFVVLLDGVAREDAVAQSERLRLDVSVLDAPDSPATTISIGIATSPTDGVTIRELVERADKNLYTAKRLGRDRTV